MRPKPYPHEGIRQLRNRAQEAAVIALRDARADLAVAENAHGRAEEASAALLERRRSATRAAAVSGAELAVAGAFAVRLQREHLATREAVQRTAAEVRRLSRVVRLAEMALHQAYIEREVIERHAARFAETERKRIQKLEDDEMDDLIPHLRGRVF
jgi:hypothetical protein